MSFPGRQTLTRKDRVVVRAIAEAMFSQDGEVSGARLDTLVTDVDSYVSAASSAMRSGLRLALMLLRILPVLMFWRLRTLERLSVDDRVAFLSRLERTRLAPLSLAFIGWRAVLTLVFYEDPVELRRIGYGEERLRHRRLLPTLPVPSPPPAFAAMAVAPPAGESGVRLRTDHDADSEHPPAAAPGSREVA